MKKITCRFSLGLRMQQVFIEDDKEKVKKKVQTFWIPISEMANFIAKQDGDNIEVFFNGPEDYLKKIEKDCLEIEIKQYNKARTVFHCI